MKRFASVTCLVAAFSLLLNAIWLAPASAAMPAIASLGRITHDAMKVPGAIDVDAAGNLYVADSTGNVFKFDIYGQLSDQYNVGSTSRGVAVTPDGSTLYVSQRNEVVIVDTATGSINGQLDGAELASSPEFDLAGEIDLDASGRVYVADLGGLKQTIKVYSAAGTYLNKFGTRSGLDTNPANGTFKQLTGIAVDGTGKIITNDAFAADKGGKVQVWTIASNAAGTVSGAYLKNAVANFGAVPLDTPRGVTIDDLGRIYFVEYMRSQLYVLSSTYAYEGTFSNPGYEVGQLKSVFDAVYEPTTKRLFVSTTTGRIEIFGIDGGTNPVGNNNPPAVPVLTDPLNGSTVTTTMPTLQFTVSDPDGDQLDCQVVVKRDGTQVYTTTVAVASGNTGSVTVPGGTLAEDNTYTWTVSATDPEGAASAASDPFTFTVNAVNSPPTAPVLTGPANGSIVTAASPTLTFSNGTDPDHSQAICQVVVTQNGSQVYSASVTLANGAAGSVTVPAGTLIEDAVHAWTVTATDAGGASATSAASTFTFNAINSPPAVPVTTGPASGSEVTTATPTLTFVNGTDPDDSQATCDVVVKQGTTTVFNTAVIVANGATGSVTLPSALTENATYNWTVTATDANGASATSAPATFMVNTVNDLPSVPTVTGPTGGVEVATLTPSLQFTNGSDPDDGQANCQVVVSDAQGAMVWAKTVAVLNGAAAAVNVDAGHLQENQTYNWTVQATDVHGGASPLTAAAGFMVNVSNDLPTVPVVTGPTDGVEVATLTPSLQFTSGSDLDDSQLSAQVAVSDAQGVIWSTSVVVASGAAGSVTVPAGLLAENQTYSWTVQVTDEHGGASPVTAAAGFMVNVINDLPTVPVVVAPVDGSQVGSLNPTLQFINGTDADDSQLSVQVAVNDAQGAAVWSTSLTVASGAAGEATVPAGLLAENQVYSWTLQAVDEHGGASPVSTVVAFTVNTANEAPALPVVVAPVDGSVVATATPNLEFSGAIDPDGDLVTCQVVVMQGETLIFQQGNVAVSNGAGSVTIPTDLLLENQSYSWTVQATDALGTASAVTTPASFTVNVANDAPSVPVLVSPLNGEGLNGSGLLTWQAAIDPDPGATEISYQVTVVAETDPLVAVMQSTTTDVSLSLDSFAGYDGLMVGSTYLWSVTAADSAQAISAPSLSGRFVFDVQQLRVTANLPGANVYAFGNHQFPGLYLGNTVPHGEAPLSLRDLPAGPLPLVIEHSGFRYYVTITDIATTSDLYVELNPALVPGGFKLVSDGVNGKKGLYVGGDAVPFVVDFDDDGVRDLLVGDGAGLVQLFPSITFTATNKFVVGAGQPLVQVSGSAVPFVADWNNDGRKDLLVGQADGTIRLFLNSGTDAAPVFDAGQFLQVAGTLADFGDKAAPVVADLDGDGLKELVVGNAAGQVVVCWNAGDNAAPQLVAPVVLFTVAGAAIPSAVDWDADGDRDLLVTAGGKALLYLNNVAADGTITYSAQPIATTGMVSAIALDLNPTRGVGKDLLVGMSNGRVNFWPGSSSTKVSTFKLALLEKIDVELYGLVAAEAPDQLSQVTSIRANIDKYTTKTLSAAKNQTATLVTLLPAGGAAQQSANELLALLQ